MTTVTSGHTSSGILVTSTNPLTVEAGGTVVLTSVASGGAAGIRTGGDSRQTTVASGGTLYLDGRATNTIIAAGGLECVELAGRDTNATVMGTLVTDGRSQRPESIRFARIDSGGAVDLRADATGFAIRVSAGGTLSVNDGATSMDTLLTRGAEQVGYASTETGAVVGRGGLLSLDGGTADDVTISAGGGIILTSDVFTPTVSGLSVASGGVLAVVGSAVLENVTLAAGATVISTGVLLQERGGIRTGASIYGHVLGVGQVEDVLSGGIATGAVVVSGGVQIVYSGGVADNTTVHSGGSLSVAGRIDHTLVTSSGHVGGTGVSDRLDIRGGFASFTSGSVVTGATLKTGILDVSGTASNTTIDDGNADLSGQISHTRIERGFVIISGTATDTLVSGGTVYLNGYSADHTRVDGGTVTLRVEQASGARVGDGGTLVQSAALLGDSTLTDTTISSGGRLVLTQASDHVADDTQRTLIEAGGQIDLRMLAYSAGATAQAHDHMLVVRAGGVVTLSLVGDYAQASFVVTSDGKGGTLVSRETVGDPSSVLAAEIHSAGATAIVHDLSPLPHTIPTEASGGHGLARTPWHAPAILHAPLVGHALIDLLHAT